MTATLSLGFHTDTQLLIAFSKFLFHLRFFQSLIATIIKLVIKKKGMDKMGSN